jgi:hypothetical protein
MSILKKQNGMSLIGWLITIGLIIFVSIPAIKIIPIYIKDMKIHSEMNKLGDDIVNSQEALKITPEKIKSYLLNRFAHKGITEITADEIIITESEFNFNVRIQHQFKERIIKDKYFILNSDRTVNIPIITKN